MLTRTPYSVDLDTINAAAEQLPTVDFRMTINEPTGDFFYDPWQLKPEYQNTVWQTIYNSLGAVKGEARIIKLGWGACYITHADIDDRYHLNICGDRSFLVDLDSQQMHETLTDGYWYTMDAGRRHSAVNFGNTDRYQLVVRQLLKRNSLLDYVSIIVKHKPTVSPTDARFLFDDTASVWLNRANKIGTITDFNFRDGIVSLKIAKDAFEEFKKVLPKEFEIV